MPRTYINVDGQGNYTFNAKASDVYGKAEAVALGNTDWDAINNPLTAFNFVLEVELLYFLPLKSIRAFTKENEYEYIREGGVNDYVHMKRKPISKPFTFQVERYIGTERFLDPLATGMLPICLGEATKFSQFLLDADKTYRVNACFGIRTDTSDSDGKVVARSRVNFKEADLLAALDKFRGKQKQVPSMYSALKYQGRHYYDYARAGIEIPREARDSVIYDLRLLSFDGVNALMEVRCSKGTYIRTLVDDLGEYLGSGAHVTMLDRLQVADYPRERMVSFEDLDRILNDSHSEGHTAFAALDALLLPPDTAVKRLPEIFLNEEQGRRIMLGQRIKVRPVNMLTTDLQPIRIYIKGSEGDPVFAGVGDIRYDLLAPKRLMTGVKMDLTDFLREDGSVANPMEQAPE